MSKRLSANRVLMSVFLCSLIMLFISGCTLPWKHKVVYVKSQRPSTQQLLNSLQKGFATVKAFHVVMQVQNPGVVPAGKVQINTASGDVVMPDKIKAQATVALSGQPVSVNLISVGENQFITDPVTGQWRVIKGVLDPRTLTNPHTGIVSLISKVQNVSLPVSSKVNGVSCWSIKGLLDAKYIAFFTGGGVPAGTMLQTSACVGKHDSLPYQLTVTGQAAQGDTAQTSRTFIMSNYNENISITAPL